MFFHPLPIQTRLAEVTNSCVAATTGSEASVNRGRSIKLFFNGNTRITLCSQLLTESQRTFVRLNWKWEAWKWIRRMILRGKWRQMPFIKLDFSSLVLEEKGDFSWPMANCAGWARIVLASCFWTSVVYTRLLYHLPHSSTLVML